MKYENKHIFWSIFHKINFIKHKLFYFWRVIIQMSSIHLEMIVLQASLMKTEKLSKEPKVCLISQHMVCHQHQLLLDPLLVQHLDLLLDCLWDEKVEKVIGLLHLQKELDHFQWCWTRKKLNVIVKKRLILTTYLQTIFHIPKVWQILNCFAGTFHQALSSFFLRVYYY